MDGLFALVISIIVLVGLYLILRRQVAEAEKRIEQRMWAQASSGQGLPHGLVPLPLALPATEIPLATEDEDTYTNGFNVGYKSALLDLASELQKSAAAAVAAELDDDLALDERAKQWSAALKERRQQDQNTTVLSGTTQA